MRLSGQKISGITGILKKHWIVLLLIILLACSSILISAGIGLRSSRPYSRYKDGITVNEVSGELYLTFEQVYNSNDVLLTVRSRTFIENPSGSGQFVNISINSQKVDVFDDDPQLSRVIYITDWNLREESQKITVQAFFTVSLGSNVHTVKISFGFLAGIDDSNLPEFLCSSGFILSLLIISFIIAGIIQSSKKKEYDTLEYGLSKGIRNDNACQQCGTLLHPDISFCTNCGQLILQNCSNPECDWKYPVHANFCPGCGFPSKNSIVPHGYNQSNLIERLSKITLKFSFYGFVGLIIINTVLLLPAYTAVLADLALLNSVRIYIFLPFPLLLITLEDFPLLFYVLVVFITILLMLSTHIFHDLIELVKSTQEKTGYLRKIGDSIYELNENGLILLFKLFSLSFAIQITVTLLITFTGIALSDPISLPSSDGPGEITDLLPSWSSYPSQFIGLIFGLINAALYEEIAVRVLLIGLPILVIGLVKSLKKRKAEKQVIYNLFGYDLARDRPINRIEWFLIISSSIIFGLAHLLSWDIWKVIPAAIVGCFLGYIFIKRGLIYAVFLHAVYNYLGFFLMLKIVDIDSLLGSNGEILSYLLAITVPLFYLVLLGCFFVSGYILLIRMLNDFSQKWFKS